MSSRFTCSEWQISPSLDELSFSYEVTGVSGGPYRFTERLLFPFPVVANPSVLALGDMLHLALGLSYYKAFATPVIEHPYFLDESMANFWTSVVRGGLAEFAMKNQLPFSRLATFTPQTGIRHGRARVDRLEPLPLLGLGGGKDSIVAGELLKAVDHIPIGFVLATGDQCEPARTVGRVMGIKVDVVRRNIDRQLLAINGQPGTYNGHVPFSLFVSLSGLITAVCEGRAWFCVGNEASASIPFTRWNDRPVNHQWSKSFDFERMLNDYLDAHVNPELRYFSVIRPLSSVAIAALFAHFPQYFDSFSSDSGSMRLADAGTAAERWSPSSPKTLSTFILLAPWLSVAHLRQIFGDDLLRQEPDEVLLKALLGLAGDRPLDCVGTVSELQASGSAIRTRYSTDSGVPLLNTVARYGALASGDPLTPHLAFLPDTLAPAHVREHIATVARSLLPR